MISALLTLWYVMWWLRWLVASFLQQRFAFIPGKSLYDLWWTKWCWDRSSLLSDFFPYQNSVGAPRSIIRPSPMLHKLINWYHHDVTFLKITICDFAVHTVTTMQWNTSPQLLLGKWWSRCSHVSRIAYLVQGATHVTVMLAAQENKARGTTFTRPWRGGQGGWKSVYKILLSLFRILRVYICNRCTVIFRSLIYNTMFTGKYQYCLGA